MSKSDEYATEQAGAVVYQLEDRNRVWVGDLAHSETGASLDRREDRKVE